MPTICLAKDGKTVDYIVGFDDLGGTQEFSTAVLEWRIAQARVIDYDGDLLTPPGIGPSTKPSVLGRVQKKTIRGHTEDDSDDDED